MNISLDSKSNTETANLPSVGRRKLIKMLLAAGPTLSLLGASHHTVAQETVEKVPITDPIASALGYIEDATKVDAAKYPAFKPGDICKDCLLYTDPSAEEWGPCSLFQNRLVAANGWCVSFAKRPA